MKGIIMNYRPADTSGDILPVTGRDKLLYGSAAKAAALRDRFYLFSGEWWEDRSLGNPLADEIINARLHEPPSGWESGL